MIARLGRWCFLNRRLVVGAWVVAFAVITILGQFVIGSGFDSRQTLEGSESQQGFDVLDEYFGGVGSGSSGQIVFEASQGAADPEVSAAMTTMFAEAAEVDGVVSVGDPYAGTGGSISPDGTIGFAEVTLSPDIGEEDGGAVGADIEELVPEIDGLRVEIGGSSLAEFEPPESELIGLAFAIVVLIIATGSVLAMGLSVGTALFGVGTGLGAVFLVSNISGGPEFATVIAIMIGLGAGIDYALFIVNRYRDFLADGQEPVDATANALDTSGRAVLFAGITVVIAVLGLLVIGLPFVTGLSVSMSTTVAVTIIAALTLLPALLGFAQHRVEVTRRRGLIAAVLVAIALFGIGIGAPALAVAGPLAAIVLIASVVVAPLQRVIVRAEPKPLRETFFYRWSRFVQAHPWSIALITTVVLLIMTIPVFGIRLGFSDESNFAEETTTRQAYDLIEKGFGPGFSGPFIVTLQGEASPDEVAQVVAALGAEPGVELVTPAIPNDPAAPEAYVIRVIPETAPQNVQTEELLGRIRSETLPAAVSGTELSPAVTGQVAAGVDFSDYLADRTVVFFGAVLVLSFLLLMMVFRSLLVPLKAVVMNLLSIGAAYGVVVMIFQWGWTSAVTGIEAAPIEPFIPMMMFAIVFGLSMDYEVFLLSRIKEEYDRTGDPVESVADGLAATARVITAAAAIMVVVFGSFLLEDDRVVRTFGTGLAVAILLDASLVRMFLVPATMELLGAKNWWLPSWIDRYLPRLDVEGGHHEPTDTTAPEGDDRVPEPV